jgi:hypothetical protein
MLADRSVEGVPRPIAKMGRRQMGRMDSRPEEVDLDNLFFFNLLFSAWRQMGQPSQ